MFNPSRLGHVEDRETHVAILDGGEKTPQQER